MYLSNSDLCTSEFLVYPQIMSCEQASFGLPKAAYFCPEIKPLETTPDFVLDLFFETEAR